MNVRKAPACWSYPMHWEFFNAHSDEFIDNGPDAACAYFMGGEL